MSKKIFAFKLLTFLMILIFLEISLQLFYRFANGDFLNNRAYLSIYQKSKNSCWDLKPNLNINHNTNEFKYKIFTDKNSFRIKDKLSINNLNYNDGKKIMFLGPSFSFGWGSSYEDTYANLIEKYFKEKDYKQFINASIPGQLPHIQLCWFINEGYKYQPDIILQTVYGNINFEISQNITEENFCDKLCELTNIKVTKKGYLIRGEKKITNPKFYLKNSAIIFYSWYFISSIRSNLIKNQNFNQNSYKEINNYNDELKIKKFLNNYNNYLKIIKKYSPNSKVIFIFIPYSFDVHEGDKSRWSHKPIDLEQPIIDYKIAIREIRKQFNVVDTYPNLKKASNMDRIYYYIDTHFTKLGNKITFETFENFCNKTECYN